MRPMCLLRRANHLIATNLLFLVVLLLVLVLLLLALLRAERCVIGPFRSIVVALEVGAGGGQLRTLLTVASGSVVGGPIAVIARSADG